MTKKVAEYNVIPLLEQFIRDCKKGRHLQKSGKRITHRTLDCKYPQKSDDLKIEKVYNFKLSEYEKNEVHRDADS